MASSATHRHTPLTLFFPFYVAFTYHQHLSFTFYSLYTLLYDSIYYMRISYYMCILWYYETCAFTVLIIYHHDIPCITTWWPTHPSLWWIPGSRKNEKLAVLFEEWASSGEDWTKSRMVIEMKTKDRHRVRGSRRWLTESEISEKYNSPEIARDICTNKLENEQLRATTVREHPDLPGRKDMWQYLVFDFSTETEDHDEILTNLFQMEDASSDEAGHKKKDSQKKKKAKGKSSKSKKKGKRSSSSSSSSSSSKSVNSVSSSSSSSNKKTKKSKKKQEDRQEKG